MTIGPFIDMTGAVDVHVHSEPDLFPRIAGRRVERLAVSIRRFLLQARRLFGGTPHRFRVRRDLRLRLFRIRLQPRSGLICLLDAGT